MELTPRECSIDATQIRRIHWNLTVHFESDDFVFRNRTLEMTVKHCPKEPRLPVKKWPLSAIIVHPL